MELDQFDRLLAEERHNEMVAVLTRIVESIPKVDNSDVVNSIEKYSGQVADSISKIDIPAAQITVEKSETVIDQEPVVNSIKAMQAKVFDGLISLKEAVEKPMVEKEKVMAVWTFDVLRDKEGFIISVNAKQIK